MFASTTVAPAADPPAPAALPVSRASRRDDICVHVFTATATLVGACLTVIGLLHAVRFAVGFLAACVVAYAALRTGDAPQRRRLERYADNVFLAALGAMTLACMRIAGEMI